MFDISVQSSTNKTTNFATCLSRCLTHFHFVSKENVQAINL